MLRVKILLSRLLNIEYKGASCCRKLDWRSKFWVLLTCKHDKEAFLGVLYRNWPLELSYTFNLTSTNLTVNFNLSNIILIIKYIFSKIWSRKHLDFCCNTTTSLTNVFSLPPCHLHCSSGLCTCGRLWWRVVHRWTIDSWHILSSFCGSFSLNKTHTLLLTCSGWPWVQFLEMFPNSKLHIISNSWHGQSPDRVMSS